MEPPDWPPKRGLPPSDGASHRKRKKPRSRRQIEEGIDDEEDVQYVADDDGCNGLRNGEQVNDRPASRTRKRLQESAAGSGATVLPCRSPHWHGEFADHSMDWGSRQEILRLAAE